MPMQIQSLVRRTVTPSRLLCLPDGVRSSPSPTNSISKVLNPHHGAWSWSKDVRMSVPLSHVYGRVLTSDQKCCTLRTRVGAGIAVGTAESALPASARYTQLRAKRNDAFVTQSSLPQVHSANRKNLLTFGHVAVTATFRPSIQKPARRSRKEQRSVSECTRT